MEFSKEKQDMSMDEILASIRRYVSEGHNVASSPAQHVKEKVSIIELTDEIFPADSVSIRTQEPLVEQSEKILDSAIVSEINIKPENSYENSYQSGSHVTFPNQAIKINSSNYSATDQNQKNTSSYSENPFAKFKSEINTSAFSQQPSLDLPVKDLLNQMATPLIKSWLDKNLRQIVEEVVEREIQKMKSGS